jgi:hypothetical protein
MAEWILIIGLSTGPIMPATYKSKTNCEKVGKEFIEGMNKLWVWYKCVPNEAALAEKKDG